jgi:N-acetylneuraminic acid mutarotase
MKMNNKYKDKITFVIVLFVAVVVLTMAGSTQAATWTQKADMPTARWGLSANVVNGKIYAIGGVDSSKKVEEYDPATDTWTEKADMPTPRVMHASSVVNGKIYAIGGSNFWGGTMLATVEEYDPATDTWTQKADMPTARNALATSAVNGKIYAIGGDRGGGGLEITTVEEYDQATDTWAVKADMPTAREFMATNVVNGKIYAFGGVPETAWAAFSAVEEYDPVTDNWTKKADMPTPRSFWLQSAVVNGKIYAFGGNIRRGGKPFPEVFRYDPTTDTWTEEDDMPIQMLGMGVSTVGDKIYIIGGTSASYPFSTYLSTVWEYDPGLRVPPPDLNGDGIVDIKDLLRLINSWGQDDPTADIAPPPFGDGVVDALDLELLMSYWGQSVDDPTLVMHWALDEAQGTIAYDNAGQNDAFLIGGPVWQPDNGKVGGALAFDGIDDYAFAQSGLNPAYGSFSVLAWVKGGAPGQVVISQMNGANWLRADPDQGCLMTDLHGSGRGAGPLLSGTLITDGNWHRIGFACDGSHRALYVDDILAAEDIQEGLSSSVGGLYVGRGDNPPAGTFWSGLIDEVRIYNRAVSP